MLITIPVLLSPALLLLLLLEVTKGTVRLVRVELLLLLVVERTVRLLRTELLLEKPRGPLVGVDGRADEKRIGGRAVDDAFL